MACQVTVLGALMGHVAALGSVPHHPSSLLPGSDGLIRSIAVPGLELMLYDTQGSYRRGRTWGIILFRMN